MVPGSQDAIEWLAEGLSFLLFEEVDGVVRRLTDEAPCSSSLEAEISRETGASPETFSDMLARARRGQAERLRVAGDSLLFAWPTERGLRVMIAPDTPVMRERAGAADLAAGVTHEVANSLTAIAGWAQLAVDTDGLPERAADAIEIVQRSASDALRAARQLLSTMRNSIAPPVTAAELNGEVGAALDQVLETLRPALLDLGVTIDARCPPGFWVGLPPATLRSVFDNLVRNAGEALHESNTAAARVTVRVSATPNGGEIVVCDNGPGVPKSLRPRVFDRYVSTKATGTGLGLALVRDAVERQGGTIVLDDSDEGARFVVSMPLATEAPLADGSLDDLSQDLNSASGVHRRPALRGRTVLIVDDDRATRTMVATALELSGAIVTTVEGYEAALAVPTRFDIALVDVHLGDGRGDELLGELRERGLNLAVILTGSHRALAPEARPDAVLRKPFELEELELLLDALLDAGEPISEESQG